MLNLYYVTLSQVKLTSGSKVLQRSTYLRLYHGCPSRSQVRHKVVDVKCIFRFYPVQHAVDYHESTRAANTSTKNKSRGS